MRAGPLFKGPKIQALQQVKLRTSREVYERNRLREQSYENPCASMDRLAQMGFHEGAKNVKPVYTLLATEVTGKHCVLPLVVASWHSD